MPNPVLMPALSPTMVAGTLAKWLVQEGDAVAPGDIIAEIETDKAVMEVEAVDEGVMGRIIVPAGSDGVAVNSVIAVILAPGEEINVLENYSPPSGANLDKLSSVSASSVSGEEKPASKQTRPPATDLIAQKIVAQKPVAQKPVAQKDAPQKDTSQKRGKEQSRPKTRHFASPLARRLAKEAGIDLAMIQPTGPHDRIIAGDVKKHKAQTPPPKTVSPTSPGEASADYETIAHDAMRKIIAARLTESKQTIPHFYLSMECQLDDLLVLRAELNEMSHKKSGEKGAGQGDKISVNDFIIKAWGAALRMIPDANVIWSQEGMLRYRQIDIAIAVAIPGGLVTPVMRDVPGKGLVMISRQMRQFVERARARKLLPQEYQGGCSAISNLGMYGIDSFSAVINPPHSTILAVGAGKKQPIIDAQGKIKPATIMQATLSCDHRAVDGALGAKLLGAFRDFIEQPGKMLL